MLRPERAWIVLLAALVGCSGSAPRVESAPAPTPAPEPSAEPAPEPEPIALEDDPTPDGPSCTGTDACEDDRQCRGPAGCEAEWACGEPRSCGEATVAYCGCDGLTFYALENCPGRPYLNVGPCPALGEELGAEDEDVVEGNSICTSDDDCRRGYVCAGVAGCGTYWTCVRRRRQHCRRGPATFCGCDGETFSSRTTCPGRPIAYAGECASSEPGTAVAGEPAEGGGALALAMGGNDEAGGGVAGESGSSDTRAGSDASGGPGASSSRATGAASGSGASGASTAGSDASGGPGASGSPGASSSRATGGASGSGSSRDASGRRGTGSSDASASSRASSGGRGPSSSDASHGRVAASDTSSHAAHSGTESSAAEPAGPASCASNRDCGRGEVCTGPEGCEAEWHCTRPSQRCIHDTQYFCGCDGRSFRASMTCPGRPHRHRGSCAAD